MVCAFVFVWAYVFVNLYVCVYEGIEGRVFITYPFQNINGDLIET